MTRRQRQGEKRNTEATQKALKTWEHQNTNGK